MLSFILIFVGVLVFFAILSLEPVKRFVGALLDLSILLFAAIAVSIGIWIWLQMP